MNERNESESIRGAFHRITSRHIARCLCHLESVEMPSIVTETIKHEFWYLSNDLKDLVMREKGAENAEKKTDS